MSGKLGDPDESKGEDRQSISRMVAEPRLGADQYEHRCRWDHEQPFPAFGWKRTPPSAAVYKRSDEQNDRTERKLYRHAINVIVPPTTSRELSMQIGEHPEI